MHNKTTNRFIIFGKFLFALVFLLNAQLANAKDLPAEIKSYLENIKSVAIEFRQSDSNGGIADGMLIIDKPYKFRCNYYEPFPIVIIGNKNYISVYDYEMENLSRIKAKENIFYFLLVDKVNFDNQFEILKSEEIGPNYVFKIKQDELNKTSEIAFDKKTKHIKYLKIFEDNNVITLKFGPTRNLKSADRNLFIIQDPDVFGKPKRLEKKDLEKKLDFF